MTNTLLQEDGTSHYTLEDNSGRLERDDTDTMASAFVNATQTTAATVGAS